MTIIKWLLIILFVIVIPVLFLSQKTTILSALDCGNCQTQVDWLYVLKKID